MHRAGTFYLDNAGLDDVLDLMYEKIFQSKRPSADAQNLHPNAIRRAGSIRIVYCVG